MRLKIAGGNLVFATDKREKRNSLQISMFYQHAKRRHIMTRSNLMRRALSNQLQGKELQTQVIAIQVRIMLTNAIEAAFQSHNAQIVTSEAIGITAVPTYFVVCFDAIGRRQPCLIPMVCKYGCLATQSSLERACILCCSRFTHLKKSPVVQKFMNC